MSHATNVLLRMVACIVWLAMAASARAHPIVSTDINRHVTLKVGTSDVGVHYIYEMLEIAAVNVGRRADTNEDGTVSDAEREAYARAWGQELAGALRMNFGGQPVPLTLQSVKWTLGPAPFGLHTWTLTADLQGQWPAGARAGDLHYEDGHRPGEAGWKEVVLLSGPKIRVQHSNAGSEDRSARLTNYQAMADLLNPDQVAVDAKVSLGTARVIAPVTASVTAPVTAPVAASVTIPAAAVIAEPVAAPEAPAWRHYVEPFFRLGMHHIATGWDHLAFLLGLLLFRQTLRQLVWVVTAFTLAHSLTLGLAALGWVTPPGATVEASIALSIAYVGAMALWKPELRHGPWIALGFGLIHGFGFAGALGETLGEVDGAGWLVALASFNLGIECLQVLLVAAAFGLLAWSDHLTASIWPRKTLAMLVLTSGIWWTLERTALA